MSHVRRLTRQLVAGGPTLSVCQCPGSSQLHVAAWSPGSGQRRGSGSGGGGGGLCQKASLHAVEAQPNLLNSSASSLCREAAMLPQGWRVQACTAPGRQQCRGSEALQGGTPFPAGGGWLCRGHRSGRCELAAPCRAGYGCMSVLRSASCHAWHEMHSLEMHVRVPG